MLIVCSVYCVLSTVGLMIDVGACCAMCMLCQVFMGLLLFELERFEFVHPTKEFVVCEFKL